jgi:hypothetical protein
MDKVAIRGFEAARKALECEICAQAVGGSRASARLVREALENLYVYSTELGDPFDITVAVRDGQSVHVNSGDVFFAPENVPVGLGEGQTINLLEYHEALLGLRKASLGTEDFQAIYLLHELGHVMGGLPRDFGAADRSLDNTRTVTRNCFQELLRSQPTAENLAL